MFIICLFCFCCCAKKITLVSVLLLIYGNFVLFFWSCVRDESERWVSYFVYLLFWIVYHFVLLFFKFVWRFKLWRCCLYISTPNRSLNQVNDDILSRRLHASCVFAISVARWYLWPSKWIKQINCKLVYFYCLKTNFNCTFPGVILT